MLTALKSPNRLVLTLAVLTAAMLAIVGGSFYLAYTEVDRVTAERQASTVQKAVSSQSRRLERELRPETIWQDAYTNTAGHPNGDWMREFYGEYLSRLLGYAEIYVVDGEDKPVFGFEDGKTDDGRQFALDAPEVSDMITALRSPFGSLSPLVNVTDVDLGNGHTIQHRSIADVRLIDGKPVNLVVQTIVPDSEPTPALPAGARPPLLIAMFELDANYMGRFGRSIGFPGLQWTDPASLKSATGSALAPSPQRQQSTPVYSFVGQKVGVIAWDVDLPGSRMLQAMSGGFAIAGALVAGIALLTIVLVRRQTLQMHDAAKREAVLARTDFLTGLPNRLAFNEEFARQLDRVREGEDLLGVVSLDLDRFKTLNDTMGQQAGDRALVALSERLSTEFPECFMARTGGDEFILLVPCGVADHAAVTANRMRAVTDQPFVLPGRPPVMLNCSIGFAIAPLHGADEQDLLRRADLALHSAKKDGGGRAYGFEALMEARVARGLVLEAALRKVLATDGLEVAFQPLMSADGQNVLGVEALARWTDAELGPISPVEFIPVAEATGLIVELGETILRKAVRAARAWPEIGVSVNVSAQQIQLVDMVETVRRVLAEEGFPLSRLEIELTESVLVADEARAVSQIQGLQNLGVKVSLDDFGTGYASLLYLRQFGFDKLKIDRNFVRDLDTSVEAQAMVMAMITMSNSLDLGITAEGVENLEQFDFLRLAGCDRLQGFYFSRPLSADDLNRFLGGQRKAA